jgi:LPXTG-motif cell wall-anchored protein
MVPSQDVNYDQFTPVGGGVLLLAGLAGAYLVGKRRKEE